MDKIICSYKHCEREVFLPRTKYCSEICLLQGGRQDSISRGGKLKVNTKVRPSVEIEFEPIKMKAENEDERWAITGINSSYKAMMEIHERFKG